MCEIDRNVETAAAVENATMGGVATEQVNAKENWLQKNHLIVSFFVAVVVCCLIYLVAVIIKEKSFEASQKRIVEIYERHTVKMDKKGQQPLVVFQQLHQENHEKFEEEIKSLLELQQSYIQDNFGSFETRGNVFAGSARNKETLEWLQNDIFGKVKQTTQSISINDERVSTSYNEKMDCLVPAAKIADMATGWICGQTARDFTPTEAAAMQSVNLEETDEFKTTKFFCKTNFDMRHIEEEKKHYTPLPKKYCFENEHEKEVMLSRNFRRINEEVSQLTASLLILLM